MAIPSSLYTEDENARQTLANGTVLKWTKQLKNIYTINQETDLSIVYTNWNNTDVLCKATKTPNNFYSTCDISAPSLGANQSGPDNVATGWTRRETGSPRVENIFSGVVLCNGNSGSYHWGYNPLKSAPVNQTSGGDARLLLDMDINKMIFGVHFSAIDLSQLPTSSDYSANPKTSHYPATVTISLKELYDHPDNYGIVSYTWDSCYVYGENTSDHWRTATVKPAFIMDNGDSIGGFNALTPFGSYSGVMQLSFSLPNGEVSPASGSSTLNILNHLEEKYVMGHPYDFELKPDNTYDGIGQSAMGYYTAEYGVDTAGTHRMFVDCNTIEYDDLLYVGEATSNVQQTVSPAYSIRYLDLQWSWHRLIKGRTMLKYFAAYGLYFRNDQSFDPDSANLTPETLGDSDKIWLGEMSSEGVSTGNWITDLDSYTGPNKDGKTSNPDYKPSGGGGSVDDEDNQDTINTTGAPFAAGLCNYYAMTAGSPLLGHISEALGTWDIENTHKDLYKNLISCKLVKPPAPIPTSGSAPFTIYGVKPQYAGADISLPVVSGNPTATFGPYTIDRKFGDFRDYAPYTRVSIYLPYCGWCDLPSHVVGRKVSVHYYTDIIAATCKAVVFCNNNIIAEAAGVIGLDIPFVADNVGAKMQAVTAGMIAALGGGIQLGAGIGTMVSTKSGSGAKAALSGASQYLSGYSQMAMAFNENTTEISGKNGDGCCLSGATNIIIKIVRPKKGAYTDPPYTPPGYGHNVGFVSQKQVKVSSVSGLLIADNVDTSGISGATEAERAEIKRVLETGLIVNAAPE